MYGADIEFFIKKEPTGRIVPACGLVGGEKSNPIKLDDTFSILEDGAAVELNYTPTETPKTLMENIYNSAEVIRKYTKFFPSKAHEVKIRGLEKFPQAMEIGCAPDFDAYSETPMDPRPTPDIKAFNGFRYTGGHLHFSYDTNGQVPAYVVARLLDLYLTIPTLIDAHAFGGEKLMRCFLGPRRAKFYGLPGLHRPKPYGVEYRTLSNYFAFDKRFYMRFRNSMQSAMWYLSPEHVENELQQLLLGMDWQKVKNAILS